MDEIFLVSVTIIAILLAIALTHGFCERHAIRLSYQISASGYLLALLSSFFPWLGYNGCFFFCSSFLATANLWDMARGLNLDVQDRIGGPGSFAIQSYLTSFEAESYLVAACIIICFLAIIIYWYADNNRNRTRISWQTTLVTLLSIVGVIGSILILVSIWNLIANYTEDGFSWFLGIGGFAAIAGLTVGTIGWLVNELQSLGQQA